MDRVAAAVEAAGSRIRWSGGSGSFRCPVDAHDDHNPSCTVRPRDVGDPGVLLACATCDLEDLLGALRLTKADLFDAPRRKGGGEPLREHAWLDADSRVVAYHVRMPDGHRSKFLWRDRDGNWKKPRPFPPLYRLPETLAAAADGDVIHVTEGEKDADRLAALGLVATCSPDGASGPGKRVKWSREATEGLRGARGIVVMADDDEPGRHTARELARLLGVELGCAVQAYLPPEGFNDLSDALAAGRGLDEFRELKVGEAVMEPASAPDPAPGGPEASATPAVGGAPRLPLELWDATPTLSIIARRADETRTSRDAVLGAALARAVAATECRVTVSGGASLNLLCALVGRSGAGKSRGESSAASLWADQVSESDGEVLTPGTRSADGLATRQGLPTLYWEHRQVPKADRTEDGPTHEWIRLRSRVYAYVDEGAILADKVASEHGLMAGLRTAWVAGPMGGGTQRLEGRARLRADDYRLAVVASMQQDVAAPVAAETRLGTAQRMLWWNAERDRSLPRASRTRARPEPVLEWTNPTYGIGDVDLEVQLADEMLDEVDELRDREEIPEAREHEPLLLVKVAAALALLHGQTHVGPGLWALAKTIVETSFAHREHLVALAAQQAAAELHAKASRRADADVLSEAAVETARANREEEVRARVERWWVEGLRDRRKICNRFRESWERKLARIVMRELAEEPSA